MLRWFKHIKAKPVDFLTTMLLKRTAYTYFHAISIKTSRLKINDVQTLPNNTISKHACWIVYDVPDYLNTTPYSNTKCIKLNTFKGTMIHLKNYNNFEDFMSTKFSSKRRAQFKTLEKRLNISYNITHKIIIGNCTLSEFNTLFSALYKMLETRFIEKEMVNDELPYWNYYKEKIHPLIANNEAFISVIYANETPISISVYMISTNAMYGYLKGYDTNYDKYGLGFLDLIKVTQWAFENNIEVFDFLKGHYDYKSKWTDTEYYFQKHIVYNSKSPIATTMAHYSKLKINAFYATVSVLKQLQVDKLLKKGMQWKYNLTHKNSSIIKKQTLVLDTQPIKNLEDHDIQQPIDINQEPIPFLKKAVNDFLFSQQEHIKNINVFLLNKQQQTYLIVGTKNIQVVKHA